MGKNEKKKWRANPREHGAQLGIVSLPRQPQHGFAAYKCWIWAGAQGLFKQTSLHSPDEVKENVQDKSEHLLRAHKRRWEQTILIGCLADHWNYSRERHPSRAGGQVVILSPLWVLVLYKGCED
ncbi:hypothetical protein NDU88_012347 [Pleurodeles waltl]|uniref:Uncharacterized protein n=1 Tax=Pleurodeles waltl TaxID=8319 RepID=A0AAV7R3L5_PLEWA|nr:hypothetical protein NDU88_012347 [Pleurodeles waltl]